MSPTTRKWLLISGAVVLGLIVVACISVLLLGRAGSVGNTFSGETRSLVQPGAGGRGAAVQLPAATAIAAMPFEGAAAPAPQDAAKAPAQAGGVGGGGAQQPSTNAQVIQRLIIKTGNITVAVENTYVARNTVITMVNQMAPAGAFVVSSQESGGSGDVSPYITMVIRVPADHFDQTMDALAGLAAKGTTPQRSENAQDVTDQYVDVKSRLDALEAARQRLQQIMSQAQNTNDLLQAEQQLTQREAEINSLKGQQQYLEQSAALSSITISLQPYILAQPVDTSWKPGETFRQALDQLLSDLRGFGDFLIVFVVDVLPWLVLLGLVIYGIFLFVRSRVRRRRARQAAAARTEQS